MKIKIVAKTQRLNDFKSRLLSSANLKIQSDVHRSNVKERIIVGKYSEEKKMRTQKYQQAQRNVHFVLKYGLVLHSVRIRKSLINLNNLEYVFLILVNNL